MQRRRAGSLSLTKHVDINRFIKYHNSPVRNGRMFTKHDIITRRQVQTENYQQSNKHTVDIAQSVNNMDLNCMAYCFIGSAAVGPYQASYKLTKTIS